MDSILTPPEIEFYVETMCKQNISDLGNERWIEWHERLQKLNQQAVIEVSTMRDEQVKESLISFNKTPVLVHEVILIRIWKQKVLPHLLNYVPNPETTFIAYSLLFHEATALGLLELALFHSNGCESLGDAAVDLLDYAYENASQLLLTAADVGQDTNELLTGCKELQQQKTNLSFDIAIRSLTIIRYLAENLDRLKLCVTSRMYVNYDIPSLFVQLLMEKPWIRKDKIFNRGKWVPCVPDVLCQTEAQLWLTLRHLLLDDASKTHYQMTEQRKLHILKLAPLLTPVLLDQLAPLIELARYFSQLAVLTTQGSYKPPLLLETVLEIKNDIMAETRGKWKKIARSQIGSVFCTDKETLSLIAKKLSDAYNTDLIEKFEAEPSGICANCGQPAIQRCSKCKKDFYCSRKCQVSDWQNHKGECMKAQQ